jgi:hypothetical protein
MQGKERKERFQRERLDTKNERDAIGLKGRGELYKVSTFDHEIIHYLGPLRRHRTGVSLTLTLTPFRLPSDVPSFLFSRCSI